MPPVERHDHIRFAEDRGFNDEFIAGINQKRPHGTSQMDRLSDEAKCLNDADYLRP
ncbi:MAG TPA: hypothetical protein VMU71_02930 [Terracidiphilus sp.]|nr:hypothetical protein [Terracidiphilus sp.]